MTYDIAHLPGQINLQSALGKIIYDLVKYNDFKNIVDIGTWNGMGTTLCILKGLEEKDNKQDVNIYTIELYKEMVEIAKQNLKEYINNDQFNLNIINGRIADLEEVYAWFDHSSIDTTNDAHARLWYHKDMNLLSSSENITNLLPDKIDLLILDGGEYSTYPEWNRLKDRTKFFVLDDTNILKCSKIKSEVISNSEKYSILYDVSNDRNGYIVGCCNV